MTPWLNCAAGGRIIIIIIVRPEPDLKRNRRRRPAPRRRPRRLFQSHSPPRGGFDLTDRPVACPWERSRKIARLSRLPSTRRGAWSSARPGRRMYYRLRKTESQPEPHCCCQGRVALSSVRWTSPPTSTSSHSNPVTKWGGVGEPGTAPIAPDRTAKPVLSIVLVH